jgi:hypothetical protein
MTYRLLVHQNSAWHELDLPNDFDLSLVLNSGFLGSKQSGSFSFSSHIPTTPKNCMVLQNAENPQIIMDRRIELPAVLMYGSDELYTWYFILRNVSDSSYRYDFRQTPGNQPRNFYERKLWQLDFGRIDMPYINKNAGLWTKNLYDDDKLFQYFDSVNPFYFEIWVNGVIVAKPPTSGQYDQQAWYWDKNNDPEARFIKATANTNYNIGLSVQKKGAGHLNIFRFLPEFPINYVQLKIYKHTLTKINYYGFFAVSKGTLLYQVNLDQPKYRDSTDEINRISRNIDQYPFRFLTYNNDSYYPSNNKKYEGIVNQYIEPIEVNGIGNYLKTNDGTYDLCTYPISPCFSLRFMLEKVAEMMGFVVVAKVFQDKINSGENYLGDLYLINNRDLAAQLTGTTIPFNTYGTSIIYADFMPDMTVKEFIDAIRTTFCLAFEYNYENGQMLVSKCSDTLIGNNVIDISDKLTKSPIANITDKTHYQLKFKNADNNVISQYSYPSEESTAEDGKDYTPIEAGFCPVINNFDLDPFLTIDNNPDIPTVNDAARSVVYPEQKANHPTPKMCFYLGNGNNGIKWSSKNNNNNGKICLSWLNQGDLKGLVQVFYKEYLEFLNNTTQWTADIWLSESEIANFRFAQKYLAYGTVFIPETINPKLPIKDKIKITLLSA